MTNPSFKQDAQKRAPVNSNVEGLLLGKSDDRFVSDAVLGEWQVWGSAIINLPDNDGSGLTI